MQSQLLAEAGGWLLWVDVGAVSVWSADPVAAGAGQEGLQWPGEGDLIYTGHSSVMGTAGDGKQS